MWFQLESLYFSPEIKISLYLFCLQTQSFSVTSLSKSFMSTAENWFLGFKRILLVYIKSLISQTVQCFSPYSLVDPPVPSLIVGRRWILFLASFLSTAPGCSGSVIEPGGPSEGTQVFIVDCRNPYTDRILLDGVQVLEHYRFSSGFSGSHIRIFLGLN